MNASDAKSVLGRLLHSRYAGVLATSQADCPYTSLVAFAVDDTLFKMVFATPRQSRKYANLEANPQVSMLIDDRVNDISDIKEATAATAIGRAAGVNGAERERCLAIFREKQPHLEAFARSESSAVVRISVEKYILVSRFQNVVEIAPGAKK